jgi:uncharacterized membrane protein YedE/YeeE
MTMFAQPCPWYVAGPLLGLLVAALLWAINKPLGALGGYVDTVRWIVEPASGPMWRVLFIAGVMVGGALSALASGSYVPTLAYGTFNVAFGPMLGTGGVVLLAAGSLIGYGARLAGGCTSDHGMCGTAMASPASLVATVPCSQRANCYGYAPEHPLAGMKVHERRKR